MKRHYERHLEKELSRLWVSNNHVIIISEGKDRFHFAADGKKAVYGKGHEFTKIMKRLPHKAGFERLWRALRPLEQKYAKK